MLQLGSLSSCSSIFALAFCSEIWILQTGWRTKTTIQYETKGWSPLHLFYIAFFCLFTYRDFITASSICWNSLWSTAMKLMWTKCFFSPADINRVTYSFYEILRLICWPLLVLNEIFCVGHWSRIVFSLNKVLVTQGKG